MAGKPNPNSMYGKIKSLAVGEKITFPADKLKSVKTMSSELGFSLERKYQTRQIPDDRSVEVTRIN